MKMKPRIGNNNNIQDTEISNSETQTTSTSAVNTPQQFPNSQSTVSFSAWSRVFFQARNDRGSRQVLPTHCPTYTSNHDTYLYVIIDITCQYLYLYPDENKLNHHKPIVDIDLKYFDAQILPNSHSCVALFARTYLDKEEMDDSSNVNSPTSQQKQNKSNSQQQSSTTPSEILEPQGQRYVFRFEFLNTNVSQPPNRIKSLQVSARNAKRFQHPKMISKFNMAGRHMLASHDDIEESRNLEQKKSIDAHKYYLTLLEECVGDSAALAKRFTEIANADFTKSTSNAVFATAHPSQPAAAVTYTDGKNINRSRMNEKPMSNLNFDLDEMSNDNADIFLDSDDDNESLKEVGI